MLSSDDDGVTMASSLLPEKHKRKGLKAMARTITRKVKSAPCSPVNNTHFFKPDRRRLGDRSLPQRSPRSPKQSYLVRRIDMAETKQRKDDVKAALYAMLLDDDNELEDPGSSGDMMMMGVPWLEEGKKDTKEDRLSASMGCLEIDCGIQFDLSMVNEPQLNTLNTRPSDDEQSRGSRRSFQSAASESNEQRNVKKSGEDGKEAGRHTSPPSSPRKAARSTARSKSPTTPRQQGISATIYKSPSSPRKQGKLTTISKSPSSPRKPRRSVTSSKSRRESSSSRSPRRRESNDSRRSRRRESSNSKSPRRRESNDSRSSRCRESSNSKSPRRRESNSSKSPRRRESSSSKSPRRRESSSSKSPRRRESNDSKSPRRREKDKDRKKDSGPDEEKRRRRKVRCRSAPPANSSGFELKMRYEAKPEPTSIPRIPPPPLKCR